MADKFTPETRSYIMSRIRQKNTKPELSLFKELRKRKVYFQKHYKRIIGTPDIALPSKKLAVFVDGDFWHGYHYSKWKSRLNSEYWENKIERNIQRDKETFSTLRKKGWKTLRIWEHDIQDDLPGSVSKILAFLTVDKCRPIIYH